MSHIAFKVSAIRGAIARYKEHMLKVKTSTQERLINQVIEDSKVTCWWKPTRIKTRDQAILMLNDQHEFAPYNVESMRYKLRIEAVSELQQMVDAAVDNADIFISEDHAFILEY